MTLDSNACKMGKHDLTPKSKVSIFESRKKRCKSAQTENIESEIERDVLDVITPTDSIINSETGAIGTSTDKSLSNASDSSGSTSQSGGVVGDEECLTSKRRLSFSGAAIKRRQRDIKMFLESNFVPCRTATIEYTTIENVMTENGLERWPTRSVLTCIKSTFTDTRYEKTKK